MVVSCTRNSRSSGVIKGCLSAGCRWKKSPDADSQRIGTKRKCEDAGDDGLLFNLKSSR
jgi:hypothetical protein